MRRLVAVLSCLTMAGAGCVALLLGSSGVAASTPAQAAGTFHPVDSVRVLDTRTGTGLAGRQVVRFTVAGRGGIPAGASAVTINLTVPQPATAGSIAVFPGDTAWNGAASVSFAALQNKQSMVTAKLGADGTLSVRNNIASTIQVVGDVAGYYTGGTPSTPGSFRAIPFQRAFDTRPSHPLAPGSVTRMSIGGHGAVPATGVAAVLANLTVLTPKRTGSASTWASDAAWDGSASISFTAGRTEQDVLSVALGSDGSAMIRNNTGVALQVVLDLIGYYLAGTPAGYGAYQPITPVRAWDSRITWEHSQIPAGQPGVQVKPYYDQRTSTTKLPTWGIPAAVVRFTVLSPARAGSLSIIPGDRNWDGSTTISFGAGATVQQQLTTVLGTSDIFNLQYNGTGSISVVADVLGYYLGVPNPLHYTSGQEINPAHGRLADISCPTATFCMAVQGSGFAETWNGTGWSKPARAGQATSLSSVSCASAGFCVAEGRDSTNLTDLETWDGASWTHAIHLPYNTSQRRVVSCASASFCMANAGASYATFDGTSWSTETVTGRQPMSLYWLSCVSATFCLGADSQGTAATFDGTSWSEPVSVIGAVIRSVSCASASFCVAVGNDQAVTFDGTSWSTPSTVDPNHVLYTVSCISSTDCRASDSVGSVLSYDGTHWSAPVSVDPNGAGWLSCSAAGTCGLIELSAKATAATFDGTSWSTPQRVDFLPGRLTGISCTAATFCVAVDAGGNELSYDGTNWAPLVHIDDSGAPLTSVSCTTATFCAAVDGAGNAVTFDGSDWSSPVSVDPGKRLAAVSCTSPSFCVAVSSNKAATFNGNSWSTPVTIGPAIGWSGLSCRSTTFCVAVNSVGSAARFNGTSWSAMADTNASGAVRDISCPTTSYCLVAGWNKLSSWDGSTWSGFPPAAAVYAISCPQAQFCVGAATTGADYQRGDTSVWDGTEWSMPVTSPDDYVYSTSIISCPTTSFCMQLNGTSWAYRLDG